MARSPGFGSMSTNFRAIHTRFPSGSAPERLNLACKHNSLARSTKSTISPYKRALSACKHKVSDSFHSPFGVLFTFPSRYLFTIGHMLVFSLRGWAPYLHTGLLVPGDTFPLVYQCFRLQDFHFLWFSFSDNLTNFNKSLMS